MGQVLKSCAAWDSSGCSPKSLILRHPWEGGVPTFTCVPVPRHAQPWAMSLWQVNGPSKDVYILIIGFYPNVALYRERELTLQMELGCLSANIKIGRISWIIRAVPTSSQGPLKVEVGGRRISVSGIWEWLHWPLQALKMEAGPGGKECRQLLEARTKETDS